MILRNQVEWALHCCSVLVALKPDERLSTKAMAEFHGVPKEYLSKALQALAQAGVVEGTLGPTGGYRLAKAPKDISFLDIVQAVEGKTSTFQCTEIRGNNPCLKKADKKPSGICSVAKVMYQADEAWRKVLKSVTLEDLNTMVTEAVPKAQLEKNFEWLLSR